MSQRSLPAKSPAPGILPTRSGRWDVKAQYRRKRVTKTFPPATPLKVMLKWQDQTRASLIADDMLTAPTPVPMFKKAPDGWCYLYVLRAGCFVKIGRTVDPRSRLQHAQSLHPEPVEFIVAVPTHAAFEPIVHKYFEPLRTQGEWYTLTDEIAAFVEWLQSGKNPLEWLWNVSISVGMKTTAADPCAERSTGPRPFRPRVQALLENAQMARDSQ